MSLNQCLSSIRHRNNFLFLMKNTIDLNSPKLKVKEYFPKE